MPVSVAPADNEVRDLEILIRANHPLIILETEEPDRAGALIQWVADRLNLPYIGWRPNDGFWRPDIAGFSVEGSAEPKACLDYIAKSRGESLFQLDGAESFFEDPKLVHKLGEIAERFSKHRGAVLLATHGLVLPKPLERVATTVQLSAPTPAQYYEFVKLLLADLSRRMPIKVKLSTQDVQRLLQQLQGLTLFEVKKVLTKLVVEDGAFDASEIAKVAEAKKEIIARSGVLEYFSTDEQQSEIAGLTQLKGWLGKRKAAFSDPERAKQFGLTPPRGILLVGVQGCGKSLCAKAIAREWGLPLIRLDPSNLYNKYVGESEKNFKRATRTAENMAPIVLWIDEMEKAFSDSADGDSGTSARIFGTLLTWMQEKKPGVFVIATCNDIERLPPELVRKGRFDEIFFVDLPTDTVRAEIFALNLRRRDRDPADFDMPFLAQLTEGFSGAEIEQVILSALYTSFASQEPLSTALLSEEIAQTVPLSVTAREKIERLRSWARERAVPAE